METLVALALVIGGALGIALVAGVGSYLIARALPGAGALLACLAWLAAPVLVLMLLFAATTDPTLSQDRASYNYAFALVITAVPVMVAWLPGCLIGGLMGARKRKGPAPPAPSPAPAQRTPVQPSPTGPAPDLPDWSVPDNPRLSLVELQRKLIALAERGGIDPATLPAFGHAPDGEGDLIMIDKFDYIYLGLERGRPTFEHATVVADALCYLVLRDRALALASNRVAGTPAADPQAILAAIDPRWGAQFACGQRRDA